MGEISHKKKSETKPEEIEQLLEKYDVSRIVWNYVKPIYAFVFKAVKKRRKKHRGKGGSKKRKQANDD